MSALRTRAVALVVALAVSGCAALGLQTIDGLMRSGLALYEQGQYAESVLKFEEVVRRDPTRWTAWLYMARSLLSLSDWGGAIESGRRALEVAPSEPEVIDVLGRALLGGGLAALREREYPTAVGRLREHLELRPGGVDGWVPLVRALLGSGDAPGAAAALTEGLRSVAPGARPGLLAELLRAGSEALARGEPGAAATLLRAYVAEDPSNVAALVELGKAYWQGGQQGRALETFRGALELSPGNAEALRYLLGVP